MTTPQRKAKEEVVQNVQLILENNDFVIISEYKGMTVEQISQYRREIRKASGGVLVAKNALSKIALNNVANENNDYASIVDAFSGQLIISYSKDPIALAKIFTKHSKTHKNLAFRTAIIEGKICPVEDLKQLSSIDSIDELRAKIIGLLLAPAQNLIRIIQEPGSRIARILGSRTK